jgi:SAM-dependent methyltransferase
VGTTREAGYDPRAVTDEPQQTPDQGPFLRTGSYLDVRYSEEKAPRGSYPTLFAKLLLDRAYGRTGSLLDLGSGRGDFLEAFAQLGFDVVGVDVSERSPALAPGRRVELVDLEREELPFEDGSFDFVFSKSVIEHLHEPAAMLTKAARVLRPGGTAVVLTPSWRHTYKGAFYYEYSHVTPFTAQSLSLALQYAGFEVDHVEHFRQLPFLWRLPVLTPVVAAIGRLPLPYRPYSEVRWPDGLNKLLRFSKEVMLMGIARKPA